MIIFFGTVSREKKKEESFQKMSFLGTKLHNLENACQDHDDETGISRMKFDYFFFSFWRGFGSEVGGGERRSCSINPLK